MGQSRYRLRDSGVITHGDGSQWMLRVGDCRRARSSPVHRARRRPGRRAIGGLGRRRLELELERFRRRELGLGRRRRRWGRPRGCRDPRGDHRERGEARPTGVRVVPLPRGAPRMDPPQRAQAPRARPRQVVVAAHRGRGCVARRRCLADGDRRRAVVAPVLAAQRHRFLHRARGQGRDVPSAARTSTSPRSSCPRWCGSSASDPST